MVGTSPSHTTLSSVAQISPATVGGAKRFSPEGHATATMTVTAAIVSAPALMSLSASGQGAHRAERLGDLDGCAGEGLDHRHQDHHADARREAGDDRVGACRRRSCPMRSTAISIWISPASIATGECLGGPCRHAWR